MTTVESFFSVSNPVRDPLWTDLTNMIKHRYATTPRHLQVELGPSEVAHPCMRKMAFGMMQVPRCNPEYDPLPSIMGTAMHTWLQGAAEMDNERLGRERWLMETRVNVTAGLSGSCDLYDRDTDTVVDWKNLGYTSFTECEKGPKPEYRGQVHLYGRGFQNAGQRPRRVALALLPRSGTLGKMHLWTEEYSDTLADTILARREAVIVLLDEFDVENSPDSYQWIPATPSSCFFCPWWKPNADSPLQCSGKV